MKRIAAVVVTMAVAAAVALAGGWEAPVHKSHTTTGTSLSAAYTNGSTGLRLDLKSLWLSGAQLTNGTMKIVNTATVTNTLPVSVNGDTVYVNMATAMTLEPGGVIQYTGLINTNGSITNVTSFSLYTTTL